MKRWIPLIFFIAGCRSSGLAPTGVTYHEKYAVSLDEELFVEYGRGMPVTFTLQSRDPRLEQFLGECQDFRLQAISFNPVENWNSRAVSEARLDFTPRCLICSERSGVALVVTGSISGDALNGEPSKEHISSPDHTMFGLGISAYARGVADLTLSGERCTDNVPSR